GDEIYSRPDAGLTGKTFGDALLQYEDCAVIGLRSNGTVRLNPPPETPIGTDDEVIAIAADDSVLAVAKPLAGAAHQNAIAARTGASYTIVSELLDDRDRQLAQVTKVDDVIVSEKVISLMVAQLSENPWLEQVFDDLFDAEGSEIYMRPAEEYLAAGGEAT